MPRIRLLVPSLLAQQNELLSPGERLCLGLRRESWCSPTLTSHGKIDITRLSWAAPQEAIRPWDWCFHPSVGWRLPKGKPPKLRFPSVGTIHHHLLLPCSSFPEAWYSARPSMPLVKAYSVANLASNGIRIFQSKGQVSLSLVVFEWTWFVWTFLRQSASGCSVPSLSCPVLRIELQFNKWWTLPGHGRLLVFCMLSAELQSCF